MLATVHHSDLPELIAPPAQSTDFRAELEKRKSYMVAACRAFAQEGFQIGAAGHVTIRDPEYPDRLWINPIDVPMRLVLPRDLVCVEASGRVISGARPFSPSALWVHSRIYQAREDVHSIVHLHSLYGRAFSSLDSPLLPTSVEACIFFEDQAQHRAFRALAFSPEEGMEEGEELAMALGDNNLLIELNHGLLTVGASVGSAAFRYIAADNVCHEQLLSRAAGKVICIDADAARQTHSQIGSEYACWLCFEPKYQEMIVLYPEIAVARNALHTPYPRRTIPDSYSAQSRS